MSTKPTITIVDGQPTITITPTYIVWCKELGIALEDERRTIWKSERSAELALESKQMEWSTKRAIAQQYREYLAEAIRDGQYVEYRSRFCKQTMKMSESTHIHKPSHGQSMNAFIDRMRQLVIIKESHADTPESQATWKIMEVNQVVQQPSTQE